MSLLGKLQTKQGSKKAPKRLGRGEGSGLGGTSGKGHKGQLARTGGRVRRGFEGGQTPLHRRLPKFGFNNKNFETKYLVVNLAQLEKLSGDISPETLRASKIIKGQGPVKILAQGQLTKALKVQAHGFSQKAKEAIEKAGGSVEVISNN